MFLTLPLLLLTPPMPPLLSLIWPMSLRRIRSERMTRSTKTICPWYENKLQQVINKKNNTLTSHIILFVTKNEHSNPPFPVVLLLIYSFKNRYTFKV
jgi:hypothetical protein